MNLQVVPGLYTICRLAPTSPIPEAIFESVFYSISQSNDELSIVCESHLAPNDCQREGDWRALQVVGPLDFALTGVLASLAQPLAEQRISIFAVSTFDTDYILVKEDCLESAKQALVGNGHKIF